MAHAIARAHPKSGGKKKSHLFTATKQYEITLRKIEHNRTIGNWSAYHVYTVRAFALFNYIHELRKSLRKNQATRIDRLLTHKINQ